MTHKTTIEVEIGDQCKDVVITAEYSIENDGIGDYEYWGSKEYDAGFDYALIESFDWDKEKYSDKWNEAIAFELTKQNVITQIENEIEKKEFNQY